MIAIGQIALSVHGHEQLRRLREHLALQDELLWFEDIRSLVRYLQKRRKVKMIAALQSY